MSKTPSYSGLQALKLLERTGITEPPVDPWHIVARLQELGMRIVLQEQPQDGFEGCTVRRDDAVGIILNANLGYHPRKRFTLAHELGHAHLPRHDGMSRCLGTDIENPMTQEREREANEFASELLIPTDWFLQDIGYQSPTFELIRGLSNDRYETSLTATALKFVSLCDEPCALVLCEAGQIKWFRKSGRWPHFLRKDCPVPAGAAAVRFFQGQDLPARAVETAVKTWAPSARVDDDAWLLEETVALPLFEQTLSILRLQDEEW